MCGIVGVVANTPVSQYIYDSLLLLQHRGQDSAGIVTLDNENRNHVRKANGLVSEVFQQNHMLKLKGNIGIGHVRYPTAGSSSVLEAQPFLVNSPYGISFAHNGNLTNTDALRDKLYNLARRHLNTTSDSECLLNIFAYYLEQIPHLKLSADDIFSAVEQTHNDIEGAYACVALINGHGIVAFRDPEGIRPLSLGSKEVNGKIEYMVASETVALDGNDFKFVRDVEPGEAVYITMDGKLFAKQCAAAPRLTPCIFEYVYIARPDSFMNGVSVYAARVNMGITLGKKIVREWGDLDIDVVIPIPETSNDIAMRIANILDKPYRQGFVKSRYVGRTFIMPDQALRENSVRKKLNPITSEFKGKNVLLVDDSIVRGTTSYKIVQMARNAGAKNVYFASAAPEVRFPNVYGIDMPSCSELIAHDRTCAEICEEIGADRLIFQDLADLELAVRQENEEITKFETSVFTGEYITGNIDQIYLDNLAAEKNI